MYVQFSTKDKLKNKNKKRSVGKVIIVFLSQLIFGFVRNLNTRYVSKGFVFKSVISGFFVKTTWLIAAYLGVSALIDENYTIAVFYVIGGVVGDYLSFKIKIK